MKLPRPPRLLALLAGLFGCAAVSLAQPRLTTFEVASASLSGQRAVRVYLPASYATAPQRRYPVLYAHDGQNVFSSAGTNVAFGWGNWELDTTADELARAGKMREIIVVAVDNSPARYAEYGGVARLKEPAASRAFAQYTAFLLQDLKPRIDAQFRTRKGPADTGTLGSSMGGICSFRLAWEHPEVFGRAASLSGAFQVETNLVQQLRNYRGPTKPIRFYFDSGVVDFMGGDDGRRDTSALVAELQRVGWNRELMHYVDAKPLTLAELEHSGMRRDKWAEAQTSQHNEFYWRRRVARALVFLFPAADSQ